VNIFKTKKHLINLIKKISISKDDPELIKMWKLFKELSIEELIKTYKVIFNANDLNIFKKININ
jgi:hypothetical protein